MKKNIKTMSYSLLYPNHITVQPYKSLNYIFQKTGTGLPGKGFVSFGKFCFDSVSVKSIFGGQ